MFKLFQNRRKKPEHVTQAPDKSHQSAIDAIDPLDIRSRGWLKEQEGHKALTVDDFPFFDTSVSAHAMDEAGSAMDDVDAPVADPTNSAYSIPTAIAGWYQGQGFIGYQSCAIIAQHWLVDKACSMPGEDAVRNGWTIKAKGDDVELEKSDHDKYTSLDIPFEIRMNLVEFNRFKNIFGIRVAIFIVDSDDKKYYEKPFNPDGIKPGSYRGISQVDPYWMTPIMTNESTSDPSSKHFYDPEFWVINGKRYHRSHLMIARGPQPADILKPTYIFGGVSLVQRIYERIYAAERTANEAPLLAMNKRTTAIHLDTEKAILNQAKVEEKIALWVRYRDNHAVKILGLDETIDQFDTSLADFDSVIMSQYQLVAAIAEVPSTKLLGTSPKGFNATGEFEMKSYHEELESLQTQFFMPMLERHYLMVKRSLQIETDITIVFDPVDSVSTEQKADLNSKKSATHVAYIDAGVVSPDEVRQALRDDKHSGFNRLTDDSANTEPGMSPENIAAFEKVGAEKVKAFGAQEASQARMITAGGEPAPDGSVAENVAPTPEAQPAMGVSQDPVVDVQPTIVAPVVAATHGPSKEQIVASLEKAFASLVAALGSKTDTRPSDSVGVARSTDPSVQPTSPGSVSGVANVVQERPHSELPVVSIGGMVVSIENPSGSIRSGTTKDGKDWSVKMDFSYGFINGTKGADGDEVDCFLGPNPESFSVFVIDQGNPEVGGFDEHKCMLGFDDKSAAFDAYRSSYSKDWNGCLGITQMDVDQFKTWLASGQTELPVSSEAIAATSPKV